MSISKQTVTIQGIEVSIEPINQYGRSLSMPNYWWIGRTNIDRVQSVRLAVDIGRYSGTLHELLALPTVTYHVEYLAEHKRHRDILSMFTINRIHTIVCSQCGFTAVSDKTYDFRDANNIAIRHAETEHPIT